MRRGAGGDAMQKSPRGGKTSGKIRFANKKIYIPHSTTFKLPRKIKGDSI